MTLAVLRAHDYQAMTADIFNFLTLYRAIQYESEEDISNGFYIFSFQA